MKCIPDGWKKHRIIPKFTRLSRLRCIQTISLSHENQELSFKVMR